mmetsp:Transcript_12981/g.32769  ORF Transcript_12981/g.32769 Transcript_12981/m.32769 type:complete len:204 (+) Transcript_12981:1954-2565(+)
MAPNEGQKPIKTCLNLTYIVKSLSYKQHEGIQSIGLIILLLDSSCFLHSPMKSDIFDLVEDPAFARSVIFFLNACMSTLLPPVDLVLLLLTSLVFIGAVSSSSNRRFRFSNDVSFACCFFKASCWDFRCSSDAKYSPVSSCKSTLRGCWAGGNGVYGLLAFFFAGFLRFTFFFANFGKNRSQSSFFNFSSFASSFIIINRFMW